MARAIVETHNIRSNANANINMMPVPSLRRTSLGDITNTGLVPGNKFSQGEIQKPQAVMTGVMNAARAPSGTSHLVGGHDLGPPVLKSSVPEGKRPHPSSQMACATSEPVAMDIVQSDENLSPEDPQSVAEYASDIYSRMSAMEEAYLPRSDYMDSQKDINSKMRAILVDWLVEVHMKYKLKTETLFIAVNLVDRYLDQRQLTRKHLQLCGVTSMLIAAKFEEIYPPEVRDFVYITDNAYTKDDILMMEVSMLTVLKFNICCPTAAHFLERYQRLNKCEEDHYHLMQYVVELCLPDIKMIRYTPSHLAAAAALLSNKLLKKHPAWPPCLVRHTKQSEAVVKACAREMCGLLEAAERNSLQAVRRKYSQPKFSCIAKISF